VSTGTNEEEAIMSQVKSKPAKQAKSKPAKKSQAKTSQVAANSEVLTLAEAAAYLRVSEDDILQAMRTRQLPARQVGESWRFLKAAIQEWLKATPVPESKEAFWETHFGALKDDPDWEELLKEIYWQRGRPMTEEG
jgi:excisionase family DNA binding protein